MKIAFSRYRLLLTSNCTLRFLAQYRARGFLRLHPPRPSQKRCSLLHGQILPPWYPLHARRDASPRFSNLHPSVFIMPGSNGVCELRRLGFLRSSFIATSTYSEQHEGGRDDERQPRDDVGSGDEGFEPRFASGCPCLIGPPTVSRTGCIPCRTRRPPTAPSSTTAGRTRRNIPRVLAAGTTTIRTVRRRRRRRPFASIGPPTRRTCRSPRTVRAPPPPFEGTDSRVPSHPAGTPPASSRYPIVPVPTLDTVIK